MRKSMNISPEIGRAAQLLQSGDAEGALALLARSKGGEGAEYIKAMCLSRLNRVSEAEESFAKAAKTSAVPGEVLANHANMLARNDEARRAVGLYKKARQKPGAPTDLEVALARALLSVGDADEALHVLQPYLQAHKQDASAFALLGNALKALDRFAEARGAYDEAIRLRPDYAVALIGRSHLSRIEGKRDLAQQDIHTAARSGMNDLQVVLAAARQLALDGHYDGAHGAYQRALALAPLRRDIHAELNRYLWEIGSKDAFLSSYRAVMGQASGQAKVALMVDAGQLATRSEQFDVASSFYSEALALDPNNAAALSGLAEVVAGDEREGCWKRAIERAGHDAGLRLGYSWYLLNEGRAEEAETILEGTSPGELQQIWYAYDSTAARMLGRPRYERDYNVEGVVAVRQLTPPSRFGSLPSFLSAVEEALDPLFQRKVAPVDQTLFGGQQTAGSLWDTANPVLLDLRDAMMAEARRFWSELNVEEGHPLHRKVKQPLCYAGSWSVRLTGGGGHTDHVHGNGTFSSANYIAVPDSIVNAPDSSAGCLRLGRPNLRAIEMPPEKLVRPEAGTIVLFPSYVWHGVERFESDRFRITTPADFVEMKAQ